MSEGFNRWVDRQVREVDQSGTAAKRIRMTLGTDTWETWELPVKPTDFVAEVDAILSQMRIELPKKRHQVVFISEDANGMQLSQTTRTFVGGGSDAQVTPEKAFAEAVDALSRTMQRVMQTTENSNALMAQHNAELVKQNQDLLKFIHVKEETAVIELEQRREAAQMMSQTMAQLPTLLGIILANVKDPKLRAVGQVMASVSNTQQAQQQTQAPFNGSGKAETD